MARAWPRSMRAHVKHHMRFYMSLALGLLVWIIAGAIAPPYRLALAGNTFFGLYLVSMLGIGQQMTPRELRKRAASADEGIILIVLLTLAAIVLSFGSIFSLLNAPGKPDALQFGLLVLSVPLGWVTLQTIMALHYAHLFYRGDTSSQASVAGGLQFPGTLEPGLWDFAYYSFVVGMTAQVSDVQVLNTEMRRVTLAHGVVSFFYNAVILAFAVNVAVAAAH
jgi:uncharacterized membrane protein